MGSVKKITKAKKKSKPRDDVLACDLFAGAGGFSLGAHLAGVEVAAAIELDKYACQTYRENLIDTGLTETHLFEADITKLTPAKVKATWALTRPLAISCSGGLLVRAFRRTD